MSGYTTPTQAGFLAWVRSNMQIQISDLPDSSPAIGYAYNVAYEIVAPINAVVSPLIYTLMVYNLGGDNLINFAPDNPPSTFFTDYRQKNNINTFLPGVVTSASDQGTASGILVSNQLKDLTIANLQNLKTPWGLTYLSYQQRTGFIWGVS